MFRSYNDTVRTAKAKPPEAITEVYNCDMCDQGGWQNENDVEIHKKKTHYLTILELKTKHVDRFCTVCMTVHESHAALIRHIKSQHLLSSPNAKRVERIIYICNECNHIFFNKEVLATHMLYTHLTTKSYRNNIPYTCPKCSKRCLLKSIWFHLQQHEIPSVSLCDICLTNFPNRAQLSEHIKTHRGYYFCDLCGYFSTVEFPFHNHIQSHKLRPIPHRDVSAEVFRGIFKRHTKNKFPRYNIHNVLRGLNLPRIIEICTLCREICLNEVEMKVHVLRDHMNVPAVEKRGYFCICGEEFPYKVVLKQHVYKMKGIHRAVEMSELDAFKRETMESVTIEGNDKTTIDPDAWSVCKAPETSVRKGEIWSGDMASAQTKLITVHKRRKLKSLLKFNDDMDTYPQGDGELVNDEESALINIRMVNEIQMDNKIEIEFADAALDESEETGNDAKVTEDIQDTS